MKRQNAPVPASAQIDREEGIGPCSLAPHIPFDLRVVSAENEQWLYKRRPCRSAPLIQPFSFRATLPPVVFTASRCHAHPLVSASSKNGMRQHLERTPCGKLPFHAPCRQALHEELLAGDENNQDRNQAEYGQRKHVAPLGELMLSEESGDRNRERPL